MLPSTRTLRAASLTAGARGAAVGAAAYLSPSVLVLGQWWPSGRLDPGGVPGLVRWKGPEGPEPRVALTFDDGPDATGTPAVLDLLGELGYPATFFCLGAQAAAHPALVREIVARGHAVGVHGNEHGHHLVKSPAWITADLRRAVEVVEDLTGRPVRHFRPPYGQPSVGSLVAARRVGLELVLWSAWGREWADRDPASVAARIERRLRPGGIVLLHDSDASAPDGTAAVTSRALRRLARAIGDRQLRPVLLAELLDE